MNERNEHGGDARRRDLEQLKRDVDSLFATALDLHKQGHSKQAESLYRAVLGVDPRHADALHLLGVLAHAAGDHAAACDLIGRAAAINPQAPQYHFNHGVTLQALLRHPDAAACYRRAVALKPDYREAYENLGVALQDSGDWDAAADAYRRALALDPAALLAHQNLGTLLGNSGRTAEAREHFSKVLARQPAYAEAHTKLASTLLVQGKFAEGWLEHEWREHADTFRSTNPVRIVPFPKWDGSPLSGKTLLIDPEQGIGDEIMFASCYPDAVAAAGRCLIECDPRLEDLFARSFPAAHVLPVDRRADFRWRAEMGAVDYRIAAGSLPRYFRTKLGDFPSADAYLRPDPQAQARWRAELAKLDEPLNVGISWRGGRDARGSTARSIPLQAWQDLLRLPGANFVSLQYGDHADEIARAKHDGAANLHTLDADPLTRVDDFVALISVLDLVVSIDNSTVFMAGAVGTPVWVLLPSSGEWRWLENATACPWHPSMLTFRQRGPGIAAWRDLLAGVTAKLGAHLRGASPAASAPAAGGTAAAASPIAQRAAQRPAPVDTRGGALLVNDTSQWYHFGCSCTSLAIHAQLRAHAQSVRSLPIHRINRLTNLPRGVEELDDDGVFAGFAAAHGDIVAALESADKIYVNGEGTLHGLTPGAVGMLYLMHIAKTRFGRPVDLINHSCYPDDTATAKDGAAFAFYRKVYEALDYVAVRESVSAALVRQMGIASAAASFDCLPLFVAAHCDVAAVQRREKTVLIAGSVAWGGANVLPHLGELVDRLHGAGLAVHLLIGANAYLAADDARLAAALRARCGERFDLVCATSEREWLRAIASSSLLVSGRFHHTIAAAFLDTPFIVMESNTPKVAGLIGMLEAGTFVSAHEARLADLLYEHARRSITEGAGLLVGAERKAQLLELARANFRSATAREARH